MIRREVQSPDTQCSKPHQPSTSIHILGDDSLLKFFHHCQPDLRDEEDSGDDPPRVLDEWKWDHERWWYKLAHVCRRWRCLVLTSASYLRLSLVCTHGTPIAYMLAHSPPLPLVIDYGDEDRELGAQDEEGILLALRRRRRVRLIRFRMPASNLRKFVVAMDGEFPSLEYLYIDSLISDDNGPSLPATFKAPNIRHFLLRNVAYFSGMFRPPPPSLPLQPTEKVTECARCSGPQLWRFLKTFIHILDNDSLLNIFYLCRPIILDEDEVEPNRILQGGSWVRERWWYKLVQVCRRWRYRILASASHLGLSLLCTYRTPVADMLAHSPPLPLVIDYINVDHDIAAEEEEGIMFALQHHSRVRRVRLLMSFPKLQKLISAIDGEFPMLEYLYIAPPDKHDFRLILPKTILASNLRHLVLKRFAFPIGPPLLTTATGLTTLSLMKIRPSEFIHPNNLLQRLSLLPQLETLGVTFDSPVPSRDVERQLMAAPITAYVTFPHLHWFAFGGPSTYLEALLPRLTMPLLERLQIIFFHQLNFSVPRLVQFMGAIQNLRLGKVKLQFSNNLLYALVHPHEGAAIYSFSLEAHCRHIDWMVASATQIFRTLRPVFSAVEHLTLDFLRDAIASDTNDEADPIQWRELFRSFGNVKTLRVDSDFLTQVSRSLQVDDGGSPMGLLPELKKLEYNGDRIASNSFDAFINARNNAGHSVALVRY